MTSRDDEELENEAFERRAKALLKEDAASLSPQLRGRIARARQEALRAADARSLPWKPAVWVPATGVAIAAAIVVIIQVGMRERSVTAPATLAAIPADDAALLLNVDNLDLLEQMEFYQWLDREPGVLEERAAQPRPRAGRS